MLWKSILGAIAAAPPVPALIVGGAIATALFVRRRREEARARAALDEAVRLELNIPASLHPVIDPDVCIGSGSCLSACPEGRILGMVNGVATLVSASHCIGHGRCAAECPVDAIKLVFGSAERGVDLPELDGHFETSRPGVHIVGELAGMGLIKNALVQGLQVSAHLRDTMDRGGGGRDGRGGRAVDVAIVGAGPAGIATAIGARAAGLSFAIVDQDSVGGTIAHYPRHKIVMTEPVMLPFYGSFGRRLMSKEDLVAALADAMGRARVRVHERTKVVGIDGERDDFVVKTSRGLLRARRVVLAIGRRGSPRPLGVPGEELPKVAYRLIDPEQYQDKRVLVVGGGDSALEAAIMLADESTAEVGIAYRRPEFARCRPLNKQKIGALLGSGRVRAYMSTDLASVEPDRLTLQTGAGDGGAGAATQHAIANDYVIACLGGELPTEFLKSSGIGIRRHQGDRPMPNPALATRARAGDARRARLAALGLALLGAAIVGLLAYVGHDYYRLPRALRYRAPAHALLKPSGLWGHGVGILATMFMLSNFIYSLRKRLKVFKGKGPIAPWLRFHVFVGVMSPLTILFHSAFQWSNHLATGTYVSLVVVVVTGLVGRYIYGRWRLDPDHAGQLSALRTSVHQTLDRLPVEPVAVGRSQGAGLSRLMLLAQPQADSGAAAGAAAAGLLLGRPGEALLIRRGISMTRRLFLNDGAYRHFRGQVLRLRRLDLNAQFHHRFKRLMTSWRVFHVSLSILLTALIALHVWISVHVGFKWIWS
jgi:thioredoxin reductase/Pyruvate/2-oxoacid:ferredoxin oxidoreductase delta subunit